MKQVKEVMTDEIVCVTMQDNVFEIADKMKKHDTGFVPVVEGKKLLGVVTDRDLVIRGYAEKRSGSASVDQVMTSEAITCGPETRTTEALKLMAQNKIRRLPVVQNGELIGVVAIGDLAVHSKLEDAAGQTLSEISESNKTMSTTK